MPVPNSWGGMLCEGTGPHKFASTQVQLPADLAAAIRKLGAKIPLADLAPDGRETEPHVTVKYGLHGSAAGPVVALLTSEPPITLRLGEVSYFPDRGDGDVVKVEILSPDLRRLNKKIAGALAHTDTHKVYHPHATIAYVKAGLGKKYAGSRALVGLSATIASVLFSAQDGTRTPIALRGVA